jgi:hypothetical protein
VPNFANNLTFDIDWKSVWGVDGLTLNIVARVADWWRNNPTIGYFDQQKIILIFNKMG